jgi:hypothetical protein
MHVTPAILLILTKLQGQKSIRVKSSHLLTGKTEKSNRRKKELAHLT